MSLFLLCDFGKINLKNLQKIQKLDLSKAKEFSDASGLKVSTGLVGKIHDGITHTKIPVGIKKYIEQNVEAPKTKLPYLTLSPKTPIYNQGIEDIAYGVEGVRENKRWGIESKLETIGSALRKKKLTKVEKLATNLTGTTSPILKESNPTQADVKKLIDHIRGKKKENDNWKPSRFTPKTKGAKPQPTTIEKKKEQLKQKYANK